MWRAWLRRALSPRPSSIQQQQHATQLSRRATHPRTQNECAHAQWMLARDFSSAVASASASASEPPNAAAAAVASSSLPPPAAAAAAPHSTRSPAQPALDVESIIQALMRIQFLSRAWRQPRRDLRFTDAQSKHSFQQLRSRTNKLLHTLKRALYFAANADSKPQQQRSRSGRRREFAPLPFEHYSLVFFRIKEMQLPHHATAFWRMLQQQMERSEAESQSGTADSSDSNERTLGRLPRQTCSTIIFCLLELSSNSSATAEAEAEAEQEEEEVESTVSESGAASGDAAARQSKLKPSARNLARALAALQWMIERPSQFSLDAASFNPILARLAATAPLLRVCDFFEQMPQHDEFSDNIMLQVILAEGRMDEARQLIAYLLDGSKDSNRNSAPALSSASSKSQRANSVLLATMVSGLTAEMKRQAAAATPDAQEHCQNLRAEAEQLWRRALAEPAQLLSPGLTGAMLALYHAARLDLDAQLGLLDQALEAERNATTAATAAQTQDAEKPRNEASSSDAVASHVDSSSLSPLYISAACIGQLMHTASECASASAARADGAGGSLSPAQLASVDRWWSLASSRDEAARALIANKASSPSTVARAQLLRFNDAVRSARMRLLQRTCQADRLLREWESMPVEHKEGNNEAFLVMLNLCAERMHTLSREQALGRSEASESANRAALQSWVALSRSLQQQVENPALRLSIDTPLFNATLACFEYEGAADEADRLWASWREKYGVQPSPQSYQRLLQVYIVAMQRQGESGANDRSESEQAAGAASMQARIVRVLSELRSSTPGQSSSRLPAESYSRLIKTASDVHLPHMALFFAERAAEDGIVEEKLDRDAQNRLKNTREARQQQQSSSLPRSD